MTPAPQPTLLCTKTGDPFQPLRLYYDLRDVAAIARVLDGLRCIEHDREAGHWTWRYVHEAASLVFPQARRPLPGGETIVLGRFTLDDGRLVFSTRSLQRGVHALRFCGPRFVEAVVVRFRVVNRWFDACEGAGGFERLDAMLDEGVTFNDSPEEREKTSRQLGPAAEGPTVEQILAADVPPIEDSPANPEDETPDFENLKFQLELRLMRAEARWKGDAEATIGSIMLRLAAAAGVS